MDNGVKASSCVIREWKHADMEVIWKEEPACHTLQGREAFYPESLLPLPYSTFPVVHEALKELKAEKYSGDQIHAYANATALAKPVLRKGLQGRRSMDGMRRCSETGSLSHSSESSQSNWGWEQG